MNQQNAYLAIDLGASSGRGILGTLSGPGKRLRLEELHRFEHVGLPTPTGPVWDLTGIWRNILESLRLAVIFCRENELTLCSVGVDCWGVDWALLGKSGELLSLPHCYRDPQNEPAMRQVLEQVGGFDSLYRRTGIQLMDLNTIFQVAARNDREPELLQAARHLLFMPDLFHYWLSGEISVERTIASTSSMLNIENADWDRELLEQAGLPTHFLGRIVDPGAEIGMLRAELAKQVDAPNEVRVITPAGHDTGCAVAAVPASAETGWAYLSSGTWSLLGAEIEQPNVSPAAAALPFTNELGVNRSVRFLKNITGLWMVQELRREFVSNDDSEVTFQELMDEAAVADPFRTLVNPAFHEFLSPGQMSEKIRRYAVTTSQPEPETKGDLVRCVLESLAFCYADTLAKLESVLDKRIDVLHIVGGGSLNVLLNQFTANAIGRKTVCGPAEATAIGNVLIQAMGVGDVKDLNEIRAVVAKSFEPTGYEPAAEQSAWQAAAARYSQLVK